jgi:4-hydroxythreonine-4-phosphate dehydrogenase
MQKLIHVTAGLKNGIGLEVFLKSYLCISAVNQRKFILYCQKSSFIDQCKLLKVLPSDLSLKTVFLDESIPQTLGSIQLAMEAINPEDILLTLPSSKEEFKINGKFYSGHTEYFREYFNNSNIVMSFISRSLNVLLLTDHIKLNEVGSYITTDLITSKVRLFLKHIKSIRHINKILFSGINPHCGENGLMGEEDLVISEAIQLLKKDFGNIVGPLAGDTLFFEDNSSSDLFVYSYHDQGLAVFKQNNGLLGINLTLGLPFLRVSPDHGTAPSLYGKNSANYLGMNYLLNEILKWQK